MSTNFPTSTDTFPSAATLAGHNLSTDPHSTLHGNLGDAVFELEKVGLGPHVFNVKGYGAAGDSSTDDTSAINSAITAANTAGGGTVFVPPVTGYYKIGSAITMKSNVKLVGAGFGSQLRHTATDGGSIINCSGSTDFEIANLRLYNSGTLSTDSAYAVKVYNSASRGSIHHCTIENVYIGVGVLDSPTGGSSNISVCDNTLHDIGLNAVGINSFGGTSNRADRNLIYTFGVRASVSTLGCGVEVRGCVLSSCQGNVIRDGNYGSGPYVDGVRVENATEGAKSRADHTVVAGNVISTVSGHGIRMSASRQATIVGNNIYNAGQGGNGWGILLYSDNTNSWSCEDNVVSGNYIEGGTVGIRLESDSSAQPTRRNVVTGNRCLGGQSNGIQLITGAFDNLVDGNYVYAATSSGIRHDNGTRNTISNNKVLNCGTTGAPGIEVVAATDCRLIENESYDTGGSPAMTYGLTVYAGPTDTLISGGKYSPSLTGGISDSGTRTVANFDGGLESIAFNTTITPNPLLGATKVVAALTGSCSIANPTNTVTGMKLVFMFTQDGTGGRPVTWGANFTHSWTDTGNTANRQSSIMFVATSTSAWKQIGVQRAWA